jgi:hypothetical protein
MTTRPARAVFLIMALAALLAGCGGGEEADPGEAQVYTSEVRSVSRWVRPNELGIDTAGLVGKKNPRATRQATPELLTDREEEMLRRTGIDAANREAEARTLVEDTTRVRPAAPAARTRPTRREAVRPPKLLGEPVRRPAAAEDTTRAPRPPAVDTAVVRTAPLPPDSSP